MSSRVRKKKINVSASAVKKQKIIDLGWNNDNDEHIDSDEEDEEDGYGRGVSDEDDGEEEETVDAKKVRLARSYLSKMEKGDSEDSSSASESDDDDDATEHDRIGSKLQRERLNLEGTLERVVADKVDQSLIKVRQSMDNDKDAKEWISTGHMKLLRGHDLTPTCVALQASGEKAISGSKDHSVILWDVEQEKKAFTLCPTWKQHKKDADVSRTIGEVLSVACSDDGRYAAVGRRDATVSIFDIRANKNNLVKEFTGHKGPVTCLSFRTQSLQMFSGSEDRCIRHYNLNEMMYVETLYGHQFGVMGIDCHRKERPLSVGRDRTARAWKLAEDTHLIFRGGAKVSSADCVSVMKDDWYLTGHDDGHLGLWMTEKKKAVTTIEHAHGVEGSVGRGVGCIGGLKGSDLAITGSNDGYLRLWKVSLAILFF